MSRRRNRRPELEWPEWLCEWALRDTPPAELDDRLRKRLRAAGVTQLLPAHAATRELLEPEKHEQADAIAAAGPGFAAIEELQSGPTRTADALFELCACVEQFDLLRALRLGASDMEFAASAAQALADKDGPARLWARVLETGLVVTYARPYLGSDGRSLGRKWWPKEAAPRELHERIISDVRSPYHAHNDRTPHRTLVDTTAMLGLDGPPIYAEGWSSLTSAELLDLAHLAAHQAGRLHGAADELGIELGERARTAELSALWASRGLPV